MSNQFTVSDLVAVLRECAGEDEQEPLDGDISGRTFEDLGYDSLALLEMAGRVARQYGVQLPDDLVGAIETPRAFVDLVNSQRQAAA